MVKRSIWNGTLSFGLVTIPVKLYVATQKQDMRLRSLHDLCQTPLRYQRSCPRCERVVTPEETVWGHEQQKDHFIVLTDEELESLPLPSAHVINVEDFVADTDIDPIYYDKTYFLEPGAGGAPAYQLLRLAMSQSGQVGIGRVAIRSRESLCAVRPRADNTLAVSLLYYANEVRSPSSLDVMPAGWEARPPELQAALDLIQSLSRTWEPSRYENRRQTALTQLIETRVAEMPQSIVAAQVEPAPHVISLMDALKASLAREQANEEKGQEPRH